MKKLLTILGSIGLVASTGMTSVVSCDSPDKKDDSNNDDNNNSDKIVELADAFLVTNLGTINIESKETLMIEVAVINALQDANEKSPYYSLRTDAVSQMGNYIMDDNNKNHYDELFKEINSDTAVSLSIDLHVSTKIVKGSETLNPGVINVKVSLIVKTS